MTLNKELPLQLNHTHFQR